MTIRVETESGSKYILTQRNGQWWFMGGFQSGVLTKVKGTIEIGKPLSFDALEEGIYGGLNEDLIFVQTSPIRNIVISSLLSDSQ